MKYTNYLNENLTEEELKNLSHEARYRMLRVRIEEGYHHEVEKLETNSSNYTFKKMARIQNLTPQFTKGMTTKAFYEYLKSL